MRQVLVAVSVAIALVPAIAGAQLQEIRQTIFGMD